MDIPAANQPPTSPGPRPDRTPSRQRRLVVVTVIALAAGLLVAGVTAARLGWPGRWFAAPPAAPAPPPDRPDIPRLPPYIMNMAGGDMDIHATIPGDHRGPPVIADPGARLEVAVRAELEVKIRVHVKLFWRKGEQLRRWQPGSQYGPFSTFRYRGEGEAPFGTGIGDLVTIVSPVADIPDVVHPAWLARPPVHWQIMDQPVVWRRSTPAPPSPTAPAPHP